MKKLLALIFLGLSLNIYSQSIFNGYDYSSFMNVGTGFDGLNLLFSVDFNVLSGEYLGDLALGFELRAYGAQVIENSSFIVELGGRLLYGYNLGTDEFSFYPYGGLTGYLRREENYVSLYPTAIAGAKLLLWRGWGGYSEYVFNLPPRKSYLTVGLTYGFNGGARYTPPAPRPTPPPALPSVRIINKTGYTIYYLRISQSTADTWGEDILDDDVLLNDNYIDVRLASPLSTANHYDILLRDEDGDTYTKWNVVISSNARITFTINDIDYDEPPPAPGPAPKPTVHPTITSEELQRVELAYAETVRAIENRGKRLRIWNSSERSAFIRHWQGNPNTRLVNDARNTILPYYSISTTSERDIVALARQEPNDFMKVRMIHDWVSDVFAYDFDYLSWMENISGRNKELTLGQMVQIQRGVCFEYAILFWFLLDAVGLDTYLISDHSAPNIGHAYNMVVINGTGYIIDTTWDSGNWFVNGRITKFDRMINKDYFMPGISQSYRLRGW